MPSLYCSESLREAACLWMGRPWGGRGLAGVPPWWVSWQIPGGKPAVMTSSKALLKPCAWPAVETLSRTLIRASSPGRRLSWHHPVLSCTPRNWVSDRLGEWLNGPHLDLVKLQMDTDHQLEEKGQSRKTFSFAFKFLCWLDSFQRMTVIFLNHFFWKQKMYYVCDYRSNLRNWTRT